MPKYLFDEASDGSARDRLRWQQVLSLRDSDFDTYSAFAELLDNSTQANTDDITTKNIHMILTPEVQGRKEVLKEAAFIDDGAGMDKKLIEECLIYSNSSRYNDRTGIGRFGVGMTYAAIFQSRLCEVYSKNKDGEWLNVVFDLSGDPEKDAAPQITDAIPKNPPKPYLEKINSVEHGTIIVLSKFDKISEGYKTILDELTYYVGRTFRHFIWGNVNRFDNIKNSSNFYINGKKVLAIDPLYMTKAETEYPDDQAADEWKVDSIDVPTDRNPELKTGVDIAMSLLPEDWRKKSGQTSSECKKRYVDRNIGLSIIRRGREVFWGIPDHYWHHGGFHAQNKGFAYQMNRWWGCEISFQPDCDKQFQVKNIKRGARPVLELRKVITKRIVPVIVSMSDKIVETWNENEEKNDNKKKKKTSVASEIVKDDPKKKNLQYNPDTLIDEKYKAYDFQIEEEGWKGFDFAEYLHKEEGMTLKYNTRHELHQLVSRLNSVIKNTESENYELRAAADDYNTLVQLLVWSYGKVAMTYDKDQMTRTQDIFEEVASDWGKTLRNYIIKLNDRNTEDEGEE